MLNTGVVDDLKSVNTLLTTGTFFSAIDLLTKASSLSSPLQLLTFTQKLSRFSPSPDQDLAPYSSF
jgi:hypothetical protein